MIASIAQGTSPCAQSARRQHPCCRPLQWYIYSPLRKCSYKCRSGRASVRSRRSVGRGSYSSRSRLAKSYGRFAPLSLKQDCFFRLASSKIKISLPGPPAADNVMIFHPEASSSRLRSDSFQKFAPATQTLEFEKQSSLRTNSVWCRRCRGDAMIFKTRGGSARSGQKKASKNLIY